MSAEKKRPHFALHMIMLAVLVWGILLAIGVLIFRGSWLGAAIVLGCTCGFVGFWKLLASRKARDPRAD